MNTRLNKNTREQLLDFAQKTAKIDPAITKRFEQAIKAADKTVAAGLKKSYPTKDMKVLKNTAQRKLIRAFTLSQRKVLHNWLCILSRKRATPTNAQFSWLSIQPKGSLAWTRSCRCCY